MLGRQLTFSITPIPAITPENSLIIRVYLFPLNFFTFDR
jgi:hypothetical protein